MKTFIRTTVLLLLLAFSAKAQQPPASVNAFSDIKSIQEILQNEAKMTTEQKRRLTAIILSYYQDQKLDVLADMKLKFSKQIQSIVSSVLAEKDYRFIGGYINTLPADAFTGWGIDKSRFAALFADYMQNRDVQELQLKELRASLPRDQKIEDQGLKLTQLSRVQTTIEKLAGLTDTMHNNKDTVVKYRPELDKALALIGFKDRKSLTDSVGKLTAYQKLFHGYDALTSKLADEQKVTDNILAKDPKIVQKALGQGQNKVISIINEPGITSLIDVKPQVILTPDADKTIAPNDNNITTKIADALAILIIKHAKQDLLLMFFQKLRTEAAKQPLVLNMFPHTYALLSEYPIYELPKFGKLWSHAIAEDLTAMPRDIAFGSYIMQRPEITSDKRYLALTDFIRIGERVARHSTFSGIVDYFRSNPDSLQNEHIRGTFLSFQMIYQECAKAGTGHFQLITPAELENLSFDDWQHMVGLLAAKYPAVFERFQKKFDCSDITQVTALRNYLTNLLRIFETFNQQLTPVLRSADSKETDQLSKATIFWDTLDDLLKAVNTKTLLKPDPALDRILSFSRSCLDMYRDIEEKNYAAMVHETLQMVVTLSPQRFSSAAMLVKTWKLDKDKASSVFQRTVNYFEQLDKIIDYHHMPDNDMTAIRQLTDQIFEEKGMSDLLVCSKSEFITQISNMYAKAQQLPTENTIANNAFINSLSKIGQFWTDVSNAKKSTDIADIIETYAVQPSSYLIKRNTRASISFNAYLGAYAGAEWAPSLKPVFGLSVPIGIAFNWGFHRASERYVDGTFIGHSGSLKGLNGACFSINFSIVDIGAVASYRINNGNDGPLPQNFNFGQLLAPGLSFSYGIKGIPLSINTGVELTPELRSLSSATQAQPAVRVYAGLFYDLPFHTFSKR